MKASAARPILTKFLDRSGSYFSLGRLVGRRWGRRPSALISSPIIYEIRQGDPFERIFHGIAVGKTQPALFLAKCVTWRVIELQVLKDSPLFCVSLSVLRVKRLALSCGLFRDVVW